MPDYKSLEGDLGRYFRSLPKSLQENIMQSGVVFRTEADMRRCVQYLTHEDQPLG
ncbi:MAG: hypothetical protein ACI4PD_07995 [Butyricicoccus sp.]